MAAGDDIASASTTAASASPRLPARGGVRLRTLVLIRWAAVAGWLRPIPTEPKKPESTTSAAATPGR